jgi:hypothetical protein
VRNIVNMVVEIVNAHIGAKEQQINVGKEDNIR